jgi:hypothetical protein
MLNARTRSADMTKAPTLKGWRIVEMEMWDKDFLDMMELAYIAFDGKAGGERNWQPALPKGDLRCGVHLGR